MKKLLSISTDKLLFEEGSAVRERIAAYAREWDEMHIIVSTRRRDDFAETTIGDNVWVYPTRSRFKIFYPLHATQLGRFIMKRGGMTHITCQDPFFTAFAALPLKKESGLPLEIQVHTDIGSPNFTYTIGNRIRKAMALSYLPKADSVRVVSERIRRYLVEKLGIDGSKITVRPIAVDAEAIRNAPVTVDLHKKYPQFDRIVLMASRLEPEKDVASAIKAWPLVSVTIDNAPNIRAGLVIVGRGSELPKLKSLVARLGLADKIVFEPWADKATLVSYYKTADLFLNTSLFEGYGMTLVEARAAGAKVVSTDVGVANEIGASIVGHDTADIARGIKACLGV